MDFEPIYRVLFNADVSAVTAALHESFRGKDGKCIEYISAVGSGKIYTDELETGAIQVFIDGYIAAHPQVRVDYIHGEDAVRTLAQTPGAVGFLYGGLRRDELFDYVRENGILPRKSFSVGQACDKRYYMEARRIR